MLISGGKVWLDKDKWEWRENIKGLINVITVEEVEIPCDFDKEYRWFDKLTKVRIFDNTFENFLQYYCKQYTKVCIDSFQSKRDGIYAANEYLEKKDKETK